MRKCFACGAALTPASPDTWTAHEFKCGLAHPDLIPPQWRAQHQRDVLHEVRSERAKRGAETRRRNGTKAARVFHE